MMNAPKSTITRARTLRQTANAPEHIAWQALRTLRKQGLPVRRQHPIGRHIVDFAIVKRKLVIEIDGSVHRMSSVMAADRERDQMLNAMGWRVLRVEAETVFHTDYFMALIQKELGL